jgi:hypothetical protein
MEKVAKDPPATGLLVTMVVEEMPAREAGIKPGDILVSYAGSSTADRGALQAAVQANEQADMVDVQVVRAGKARALRARGGRLGVQGVPVQKGVPIETRPSARKVAFDYSALGDGMDFWMSFTLAKRKAGFEHHVYGMRGSRLHLDYEVAFDGGKAWGLNHFLVNLVLSTEGARPEALSVRFENPIAGWVTEGNLTRGGSARIWRSAIRSPSGRENNDVKVPAELLPSYAIASLPLFMKPEPGACLHYTPLNEGLGVTSTPAGLVCVGEEDQTLARRKVRAWRWESHAFGEQQGTTWVADGGARLKVSYGGPTAIRVTRDEALAGVNAELEPKTG